MERKQYTNSDKKAYWIGYGVSLGRIASDKTDNLKRQRALRCFVLEEEKNSESFNNGRKKAGFAVNKSVVKNRK